MYEKIGICQWSIPAPHGESGIRYASESGLRGVELDLGAYEEDFPLSQRAVQAQYDAWRERWGIAYPSLAVNALCRYGMSEPSSRQIVETAIAKAVETAAALHIPIVQLPSFFRGDITSPDGYRSTVACLQYACQRAEGTELIVGSENALSAAEQLELVADVGYANFRIYFDTRNPFGMKGYDATAILKETLPYVCEVHVKDGVDGGASQPLGKGNSGFTLSMQVLQEHRYAGWLILENEYRTMSQDIGAEAKDLIRNDITTVRSFF